MKTRLLIGILLILALLAAGCSAPTCYPPNKILDNKCCLDDDSNKVCDYEEGKMATQPEAPAEVPAEVAPEETPEPQITKVKLPEPAKIPTGLQLGKQEIKLGEPRKYLEINQLSSFKTSNDRGLMDYMVYTVRNIDQKDLTLVVELMFEGARVEEYTARVKKEYFLPVLKAGEKLVMNQSLGIRFSEVDEAKDMTLTVYERYSAPKTDLEVLKKTIVPSDYFVDDEVHTYGLPE
jgi:hypothetical protein